MTVKLNLTIDEEVVAKSKALALKRNTSLSRIVEDLLTKENQKSNKNAKGLLKYAGILTGQLGDEKVKELLERKRKKYGY
jgi:hypothetical protein